VGEQVAGQWRPLSQDYRLDMRKVVVSSRSLARRVQIAASSGQGGAWSAKGGRAFPRATKQNQEELMTPHGVGRRH
jgi:hypothetical protein